MSDIEATAKAKKAAYDKEYRLKNKERLKLEKAAWYKKNVDREKRREYRKLNMQRHVAYCRTPEYKAKKSAYDKRKRLECFGSFAEARQLLDLLEKEIRARATYYERSVARGYFTRNSQNRRKLLCQTFQKNLALRT